MGEIIIIRVLHPDEGIVTRNDSPSSSTAANTGSFAILHDTLAAFLQKTSYMRLSMANLAMIGRDPQFIKTVVGIGYD